MALAYSMVAAPERCCAAYACCASTYPRRSRSHPVHLRLHAGHAPQDLQARIEVPALTCLHQRHRERPVLLADHQDHRFLPSSPIARADDERMPVARIPAVPPDPGWRRRREDALPIRAQHRGQLSRVVFEVASISAWTAASGESKVFCAVLFRSCATAAPEPQTASIATVRIVNGLESCVSPD